MAREQHVIESISQRRERKGRGFICDEDIRNVVHEGRAGILVRLRLPSYRSLPLSCIDNIELSIDGEPVERSSMTLVLEGHRYAMDELRGLFRIFWFILDSAGLFIERREPLGPGEHHVRGVMVTVEPYMTVGRFPIFYPAERRLTVAADL